MLPRIVTPRQLNTLRWYARRPLLWKQLFRVVREKRAASSADVRKREAEKLAATEWSERYAVSEGEALARITGSDTLLHLAADCPGEVAAGQVQQASCPVKMGSGADYDLLYTLAERIGCVNAVETGVAFGWSSFALLHSLVQRGGRLISTDMPYPLRENDAFVGCVVPSRLRAHWTLLRAADRDALPPALRKIAPLDLCHYDSDKSRAGRLWAYPRLWRALRAGGIFMTDDVQDNFAFAEYSAAVGVAPLVVRVPERDGFKYAGILVKP